MRRLRALALLLLPLLALMLRPEPHSIAPRKAARPGSRVGEAATKWTFVPVAAPESDEAAAPPTPEAESADQPSPVEAPEAPTDPDGWRTSRVVSALVWLARHQNEDGSWGDGAALLEGQFVGRAGITSQVLLSMFGAGYSQLSKDEYDGTKMGDSIRRALKWMLKDQRDDGSFESAVGVFDQALATLALSEGYGMTASGYLKIPARKALDALIPLQYPDGSWGPSATSVAAMHALASATLSELEFDESVQARALRFAETSLHPGMPAARMILTRQKPSPDSPVAAALFQARPAGDDLAGWLHASTGIFLSEGPEGVHWKAWKEPMLEVLAQARARDGSWPGGNGNSTILRTCLAAQMNEIFYRYTNVFTTASK